MLKKIRENKAVKIVGNILYVLSFILVVLILLVVLIQRFSGNDIALGGIRVFYVASGSMLPEYEVGDILISMETDPEDINVGDAVTYLGDEGDIKGKVVTHEVIEKRQGLKIACLEAIAYNKGWISKEKLREIAQPMIKNQYGQYLMKLSEETQSEE